jgi:hypothetical protein
MYEQIVPNLPLIEKTMDRLAKNFEMLNREQKVWDSQYHNVPTTDTNYGTEFEPGKSEPRPRGRLVKNRLCFL